MKRKRTRIAIVLAGIMLGPWACENPTVVCTSEGATWQVSPSRIDITVGQFAHVEVVQVSCSGRRRDTVYPWMSVSDTMVAKVINTERSVLGRTVGTTILTLTADKGYGPAEIPVTVR